MTNHDFHPVIPASASASAPTTDTTAVIAVIAVIIPIPAPAPEFDTTIVIAIAAAAPVLVFAIAADAPVFIGSETTILYRIVPVAILKVIIVKNHADLFVPISIIRIPTSTSIDHQIDLYNDFDQSKLVHYAATICSIDLIIV